MWLGDIKAEAVRGGILKSVGGDKIEETLKLQWGRLKRGGCMGASFYICGWGERSEPWPCIQRFDRGLLKGPPLSNSYGIFLNYSDPP